MGLLKIHLKNKIGPLGLPEPVPIAHNSLAGGLRAFTLPRLYGPRRIPPDGPVALSPDFQCAPMLKLTVAIVVHLMLLVLACTGFTVISGWVSGDWQCNFYTYRYANGWGHVYQSDYTLSVVLTYMAAYGVGFVVYLLAWGAGSRSVAATGLALCGIGLVSFGIEGSHWAYSHKFSWIASFPAVMFPLAVVAAYQLRGTMIAKPPES